MASKTFDNLSLDQALEVLQLQVAGLTRPAMAAFFAVAGEALLPLYVAFSQHNGWGDAGVLREALTKAFGYATGGPNLQGSAGRILKSIESVAPHGDRFDAPESTYAQDAAICVDAAVRAGNPTEEVNPAWVQYALEPAITMLCMDLPVGSWEMADAWRAHALKHPGLRKACEALSEMAAFLEESHEKIGSPDVETLRQWASQLLL
jgi:Protein of unknown function (DUF416)